MPDILEPAVSHTNTPTPSSSLPPTPTPTPHPTFTRISVLALLIFVAISGYLFWQNRFLSHQLALAPSPTPYPSSVTHSDWRTYSNKVFNYELQYPQSVSLREQNNTTDLEQFGSDHKDDDVDVLDGFSIEIQVNPQQTNIQLSDYVQTQSQKTTSTIKIINPDIYKSTSQINSVTIGKIYGYSYTISTTLNNRSYMYFLSKGKIFSLTITVAGKSSQEYQKIIDQILSTFKFTDSKLVEEKEVKAFSQEFAATYSKGNWSKLKTMLTIDAQKQMEEMKDNLGSPYNFDSYEVTDIKKNKDDSYTVTVRFILNGKTYKNPGGDPQIQVVKENGAWKSVTWYLYQ